MASFLPSCLWLFNGFGLTAICLIVAYAISNDSGHTGWEPYSAFLGFVPLVLVGGAALLGRRRSSQLSLAGLVAVAIGLVGILVVVYLDQTNRLVQYDRWIRRGLL